MPEPQLTGNLGQLCGEESIIQTFKGETLNYCVSFACPSPSVLGCSVGWTESIYFITILMSC